MKIRKNQTKNSFCVHTSNNILLGKTDISLPLPSFNNNNNNNNEINKNKNEVNNKKVSFRNNNNNNKEEEEEEEIYENNSFQYSSNNNNNILENNNNNNNNNNNSGNNNKSIQENNYNILTITERLNKVWYDIHQILLRLIDLGYDRSMLFAVLPYVEKKRFDKSLQYVHQRFLNRVSESWRIDEPTEVVSLCQSFIRLYNELNRLLQSEREVYY